LKAIQTQKMHYKDFATFKTKEKNYSQYVSFCYVSG